MRTEGTTVTDILNNIPDDKKPAFEKLYNTIKDNIPNGFEAAVSYGMISFVVPLSLYPAGYHCKANEPLPFISMASQKNSINLYHMGIYANPELLNWFVAEYPKHCKRKLDMGKSCIRFKYIDDIPYELITALMQKMTPEDWIAMYENAFKK